MILFMQAGTNTYSLLADLMLLVHFAFVAFVVLGFLAIWVGYFCRWPFVRDLRFRVAHLLAMSVVLAGGGTAGHIEPALAVADALRRMDPRIPLTCLGTERLAACVIRAQAPEYPAV